MRFQTHFVDNHDVGALISEFHISQGPLYHYTDRIAGNEMALGRFWMTRADCFLDPSEITHGIEKLSSVAEAVLTSAELDQYQKVLSLIEMRCQSCFVLSLSQDSDNKYLIENYAKEDGVVLEFEENFPRQLYQGWQSELTSKDSFRAHYLNDDFDFFEGFVVYEDRKKEMIARKACDAYSSLANADPHVVDVFQFVDVVLQCIVLFKGARYFEESEYRIAFVARSEEIKKLVKGRPKGNKDISFIKVVYPKPNAKKTSIRELK